MVAFDSAFTDGQLLTGKLTTNMQRRESLSPEHSFDEPGNSRADGYD